MWDQLKLATLASAIRQQLFRIQRGTFLLSTEVDVRTGTRPADTLDVIAFGNDRDLADERTQQYIEAFRKGVAAAGYTAGPLVVDPDAEAGSTWVIPFAVSANIESLTEAISSMESLLWESWTKAFDRPQHDLFVEPQSAARATGQT